MLKFVFCAVSATVVTADECGSICSLIAGACSSKGSYCKNGHACMDLFWFTENRVVCNSENSECTGRSEVLCSAARGIVESGNRDGIISWINSGGSSTTTTTTPVIARSVLAIALAEAQAAAGTRPSTFTDRDESMRTWFEENANIRWAERIWDHGLGFSVSALSSMESVLTPSGMAGECMGVISTVSVRPVGLFMIQSALALLRRCTIDLVAASDPTLTSGEFVEAVRELIAFVYHFEMEAFSRRAYPIPDTRGFALFRESLVRLISGRDGVGAVIGRAIEASADAEISSPDSIIDTETISLSDAKAVINTYPNFDHLDMVYWVEDRSFTSDQADSYLYINMNLGSNGRGVAANMDAWQYQIGSFLVDLHDTNRLDESRLAVYRTCVGESYFTRYPDVNFTDPMRDSDLYFYLQDNGVGFAIRFYKCLLDGILGGQLVVPADLPEEDIATKIVYLVRATSRVPAFLILNQ